MKKNRHTISKLLILCIIISILSSEWIWATDKLPYELFIILRIAPLIILSITAFSVNAIKISRDLKISYYSIGVGFFLIYYFVYLMTKPSIFSVHDILRIMQGIIFGYLGFWIAKDNKELFWIVKKMAFFGALFGVLDVITTYLFPLSESILLPKWPIRLFVLFGYTYYLYQILFVSKQSLKSIFYFVCCLSSVLITFGKPIVFSMIIATFSMLWFFRKARAIWFGRAIYRFAFLSGFFILVFISVNHFTKGRTFSFFSDVYYNRFLRISPGYSLLQMTDDDFLMASGGRLEMWPLAIDMIKEEPLFGYGKRSLYKLGDEEIHFHNWFLDMLIWVGLIGSLPFFIGLFWWFKFASSKIILTQAGAIIIPSLCYTIGLTAYNLGGTILSFHTVFSLFIFVISLSVGYAKTIVKRTN